ncbi:aconitase/3-isopropylmalate dehydratase large subunit family protein [Pantoea sp. 1.19]|uniref:3-isopropylmalate dehydratase large subunit n=1 Tax=Pantoea sp. 1.19 TaxID=1925589 RepID=UPI0009491FA6|nr:aconitase/3-isopropylmalate dehydratase large subunit family protein [Pantoea sp. 1.19]
MGYTLTQKILARASGRDVVHDGEMLWVNIDCLMSHDPCLPGVASVFHQQFGAQARVWDPERVVLIPDHFVWSADAQANENIRVMRDFAARQGIVHFYDPGTPAYKGVCHIGLAEGGHARPGEVLLGTDSHTVTAGAFGAFAVGVGITDAAYAMGTGQLPLKVPATTRVNLVGTPPPTLMAKDMILALLGQLRVDGATYETLEFGGSVVEAMSVDERMTLCNMVVECGAKNGIMAPNAATLAWLAARGVAPGEILHADEDALYRRTLTLDVSTLRPQVARPGSPDNVVPVDTLSRVALGQAYIGSCTGGKREDFIAAARVLKGHRVAIPTFAVPATKAVFHQLIVTTIAGQSIYQILCDAGVMLTAEAGCAACCGGPADTFGRVNDPISVISTTNRNFVGRMGHKQAQIYLASPATVAASAIAGHIIAPEAVA